MTNKNEKSKTVLITGVTSGIGRQLTYLFAKDGYDLILVARNKEKLDSLEKEIQKKYVVSTTGIIVDLTSNDACQQIAIEVKHLDKPIDILVNNAGFNVYGPLYKTEILDQQKLIQVNLITPTLLTRIFLPDMLKRGIGKILFIGSTGSFMPVAYNTVYGATKAYILSFAEALTQEVNGTGVSVTCLCPGATQTEFASKANMTRTRLFQTGVMDAKFVSRTGYNALMAGKPLVIAGLFNKIQVQAMKLTPRCIAAPLTRYIMSEHDGQ
ncbi:MAG: oxidoreductase, family [Firmicutes bacterium]|nr:oxidoreductase, family [Bacillota bacterium]